MQPLVEPPGYLIIKPSHAPPRPCRPPFKRLQQLACISTPRQHCTALSQCQ